MICTKCGANIPDGNSFCTACGTPAAPAAGSVDNDRTVLVNQDMINPGQPQGFPNPAQPGQPGGAPMTGQPQTGMPNGQFTQPQGAMPNGQFTQPQGAMPNGQFTQPQGAMPNGQFTQPQGAMPNGQFTQPQGMMPNGQFTQPQGMMPNGQFTQPQGMMPNGQFSQPQGAPNGYYGAPQPGMPNGQFGAPQGMYNRPPKPPRKPLSKKAKIGIVSGVIAAIVLIVFFVVLLPILTRSKLKGSYTLKDGYYNETITFDDGTYVIWDNDEEEVSEAGTYTIKDNKVKLKDLEGYTTDAKFDPDDNKFYYYSYTYKSTDKKAKTEIKLTEDYWETTQERIEACTAEVLKDTDIAEEAYWHSYYIEDDALANPDTEFEKAFVKEFGYDTDTTFKYLLENGYIEIDIYTDYDGNPEFYYYVW